MANSRIRSTLLMENHTCPWWLIFTFDNPMRKLIHNPEQILGGFVKEGNTALDIGCGMGYFSIALARMVGENGKVISVDLQKEMLLMTRNRARKANVESRIQFVQSNPEALGVSAGVDFALAFWMVHEVSNPCSFFREVYQALNPDARFMIVEPIIHVQESNFQKSVKLAYQEGFRYIASPKVKFSRAVVLGK